MSHRALLGLLALCALAGCGPSDEEVGRVVLMTAPLFCAAGAGVLTLVRQMWTRFRPDTVKVPWRNHIFTAGALLPLAFFGALHKFDFSLFLLGLWWIGTSYLSLLLVAWRVLFHFRPARSFSWLHLPLLALFIIPAVPMAFGMTNVWQDWILILWTYPGFLGLLTGLLFAAAMLEPVMRARRQAPRP
jgi:hypothetical protein